MAALSWCDCKKLVLLCTMCTYIRIAEAEVSHERIGIKAWKMSLTLRKKSERGAIWRKMNREEIRRRKIVLEIDRTKTLL